MAARPRDHERALRSARDFLLPNEEVVIATNRHWIQVAEPVATCILALLLVIWVNLVAPSTGADLLWWVWFVIVVRTGWCVLDWRRSWFISTDQRYVLVSGIIIRKIAMMPLQKVTDVTYHRSIVGQVLNYGTFRFETPGQDQAFSEIDLVPQPNDFYRIIVEYLIGGGGSSGGEEAEEPEAAAVDPDPTRPIHFDFGNRPGSHDSDLYSSSPGGNPRRAHPDDDTVPFVIPSEWRRTDGESRGPLAGGTGTDPFHQGKVVGPGTDGSRLSRFTRLFRRRDPHDAALAPGDPQHFAPDGSRTTPRSALHDRVDHSPNLDTGPIIEVKGNRWNRRGFL